MPATSSGMNKQYLPPPHIGSGSDSPLMNAFGSNGDVNNDALMPSIIWPLYIDNLVKDFGLDAVHHARLLAFVKVYRLPEFCVIMFIPSVLQLGSIGVGMSQADLATQLYMLAVMFTDAAERCWLNNDQGSENYNGLFADLKIHLEDNFTLTSDQRVCDHHNFI